MDSLPTLSKSKLDFSTETSQGVLVDKTTTNLGNQRSKKQRPGWKGLDGYSPRSVKDNSQRIPTNVVVPVTVPTKSKDEINRSLWGAPQSARRSMEVRRPMVPAARQGEKTRRKDIPGPQQDLGASRDVDCIRDQIVREMEKATGLPAPLCCKQRDVCQDYMSPDFWRRATNMQFTDIKSELSRPKKTPQHSARSDGVSALLGATKQSRSSTSSDALTNQVSEGGTAEDLKHQFCTSRAQETEMTRDFWKRGTLVHWSMDTGPRRQRQDQSVAQLLSPESHISPRGESCSLSRSASAPPSRLGHLETSGKGLTTTCDVDCMKNQILQEMERETGLPAPVVRNLRTGCQDGMARDFWRRATNMSITDVKSELSRPHKPCPHTAQSEGVSAVLGVNRRSCSMDNSKTQEHQISEECNSEDLRHQCLLSRAQEPEMTRDFWKRGTLVHWTADPDTGPRRQHRKENIRQILSWDSCASPDESCSLKRSASAPPSSLRHRDEDLPTPRDMRLTSNAGHSVVIPRCSRSPEAVSNLDSAGDAVLGVVKASQRDAAIPNEIWRTSTNIEWMHKNLELARSPRSRSMTAADMKCLDLSSEVLPGQTRDAFQQWVKRPSDKGSCGDNVSDCAKYQGNATDSARQRKAKSLALSPHNPLAQDDSGIQGSESCPSRRRARSLDDQSHRRRTEKNYSDLFGLNLPPRRSTDKLSDDVGPVHHGDEFPPESAKRFGSSDLFNGTCMWGTTDPCAELHRRRSSSSDEHWSRQRNERNFSDLFGLKLPARQAICCYHDLSESAICDKYDPRVEMCSRAQHRKRGSEARQTRNPVRSTASPHFPLLAPGNY